MVAHAGQLAVQVGLNVVRLYTSSLFEVNIRLYTSLGYEFGRSEERKGGIAIHMIKRLA
ncbi:MULTISPECIES: hypothetical protein [Pectobacterium]|uniref:hypothetical protein n=1 Tax=Pectobacterium TaxID=122277 RepID=UPI003AFA89E9